MSYQKIIDDLKKYKPVKPPVKPPVVPHDQYIHDALQKLNQVQQQTVSIIEILLMDPNYTGSNIICR
jgi:hypothetical protein